MNILVTGGAGYIGSHTCVELLNSGYDVTVIDNLCNANPKSLNRVEAITGRKVKFYEGDVRDEALLRKIFAENEISAVIHFAGLKAVGESVAQPWRYYDNNLNTTLVLTKVMTDVGCKKIIFSSSATVYSGDNEMPLRETSRTGSCTNPYGWTKYMTEQILSGIAFADKEWSVVLLRYFNPIGGVSFVGGTGKISGIVLGVFVLRIIFVALSMLGIDPSMQYIIKGGIILAACSLDMRKYLAKK